MGKELWKQARVQCDICNYKYIAIAPAQFENVKELGGLVVIPFEDFECPKCRNMSCDEIQGDEGEHVPEPVG